MESIAPIVTIAMVEEEESVEIIPDVTVPTTNESANENTTIVISSAEANAKYLNQQFIADATTENKKSSKLRNLFEKAQDQKPVLIRSFFTLRGKTPVRTQCIPIVQAERNISVADIYCKQHEGSRTSGNGDNAG